MTHHCPSGASQIKRVNVIEYSAGDRQADHRPKEGLLDEYRRAGKQTADQQLLLSVDIAQDTVQQRRPLNDRLLDELPFIGGDDQRESIELPVAIAGFFAIDRVGDPVFLDGLAGPGPAAVDFLGPQLGQLRHQPLPVWPGCAAGG